MASPSDDPNRLDGGSSKAGGARWQASAFIMATKRARSPIALRVSPLAVRVSRAAREA